MVLDLGELSALAIRFRPSFRALCHDLLPADAAVSGDQSSGWGQGSTVMSRAGHLPCVVCWDLATTQSALVNSVACPGRRAAKVPVALSVLMAVRARTDGCEL